MTDHTETDDGFEETAVAFGEYATAFQADVLDRRESSASFVAQIEDQRTAFEETADRFQAFTDAFTRDVDEKRRHFETANDGFVSYRTVFARDIESKRDVSDITDDVAALRQAFTEAADSFQTFADEFDVDSELATLDTAAFESEVETARAEFTAAVDAFHADVDRIQAEAGSLAPTVEHASDRSPTTAVEADTGKDESAAVTDVEADGDTGTTESTTSTESTDTEADDPSELGFDDDTESADTGTDETPEPDIDDDTETENPAELGFDDTNGEADSGTAADDDQEATDENQIGDEFEDDSGSVADNLDRDELVDRLLDVQYAKLKTAANSIGYDGNLNAATKDELVEFIADNGDQLQEQLETEGE